VNTRPTRIHLEFYVKNGWIYRKTCEIEINPPGIYMNTITSSATLHEEVMFDNASSIMGDEYFTNYNSSNRNINERKDLENNKYIKIQSNNLPNEINTPCN